MDRDVKIVVHMLRAELDIASMIYYIQCAPSHTHGVHCMFYMCVTVT